MEMIGHYDEFMKSVGFAVAIVKESFGEDSGIFVNLEYRTALPAFCGDEVRGIWCTSVLRYRHLTSFLQRLKPVLWRSRNAGARSPRLLKKRNVLRAARRISLGGFLGCGLDGDA